MPDDKPEKLTQGIRGVILPGAIEPGRGVNDQASDVEPETQRLPSATPMNRTSSLGTTSGAHNQIANLHGSGGDDVHFVPLDGPDMHSEMEVVVSSVKQLSGPQSLRNNPIILASIPSVASTDSDRDGPSTCRENINDNHDQVSCKVKCQHVLPVLPCSH